MEGRGVPSYVVDVDYPPNTVCGFLQRPSLTYPPLLSPAPPAPIDTSVSPLCRGISLTVVDPGRTYHAPEAVIWVSS